MKKKEREFLLKIKRANLFLLGLFFFFFPSQNFYALIPENHNKTSIKEINFPIPPLFSYPVNQNKELPPKLTARSVVVMDKNSSVVLYSRNENLWVLPASTTKIMTALVALDYYPLEKVLTVGKIEALGQKMDLKEGEKITVLNLLYGLLVSSANDAALVLAQNYPGGVPGFVSAMNFKAKQLNLINTYFANPTGLDSDKEGKILLDYSYTTALDLARLTSWALNNSLFKKIVSTQKVTVTDISGKIVHPLYNLNLLLGSEEGVLGVKTGWTEEAGECLVTYVQRDNKEIIIVVLGSKDRFGETKKLINWVFNNFQWVDFTSIFENY
ncbi:MAG: D-alanyl-D-alanine carboxypeptidase family protein [Microgenomates group bacterium]